MTQVALLIAICLGTTGSSPVQLKPDHIVDRWEITNSGWDNETLVLRKDGSFSHIYLYGNDQKTETGSWRVKEKSVYLFGKNGKDLGALRFVPGTTTHLDSLVISSDTVAERSYWVAEQRLAGKVSDPSEAIMYSEKGGVGYRIGFSEGRDPYFAVDLWPMKKSDIDRLKKLVIADLRARGLKPVYPIQYDIRGF